MLEVHRDAYLHGDGTADRGVMDRLAAAAARHRRLDAARLSEKVEHQRDTRGCIC
jgi:hypothetical protein